MLLPLSVETYREWEQKRDSAFVTYIIIGLCVLAHVALVQLPEEVRTDLFYRFGVVKYTFKWYSPFTCTLLHGGWLHLLGNMFFLWVYGAAIEKLLGSWRFLGIYLLAAVCSVGIHLATLANTMIDLPAIGASGAISGILGAFFILMPKAKLKCAFIFFLRPLIATLPAWVVLGMWFLMQLYFGADPLAMGNEVAFWAHVGGFCAGACLGTLYDWRLKRIQLKQAKAWREPLRRSWHAYLRGDFTQAVWDYDEFRENTCFPGPDDEPVLGGVLHPHGDEPGSHGDGMFNTFARCMNTFKLAGALTIYLKMIQTLPPAEIPAAVHRQAGEAAISCGLPELGLRAIARALEAGLSEGVGDILKKAEAAARYKMGNPKLAQNIGNVRKVGG
jgi:membrane associated rhomboid family serine protease